MDWKNDIIQHYKDDIIQQNETKKKFVLWNTKKEIIDDFDNVIIPALEAIEAQLKPFANNVKIIKNFYTYTFKAYIQFEERNIKKSLFCIVVKVKINDISFPSQLDSISSSGRSINLTSKKDLNQKLIISEFMKFFNGRSKLIKRVKEAKCDE